MIAGVPTRVFLFLMRACFSGGCFVQAHPRETQQAFLEGHVGAFEFFGGVFGLVRYDNLRSAVAKVLKGRRRVESDRFVALRSHYLYESSFTRRGKEGAHEKGGVEGDVGRFRRAYLVPVPEVASLAELNDRLAAACISRSEAHDPRAAGDGRRGARPGSGSAALVAGRAVRHGGARDARAWTASRWRRSVRTSTRCRCVSLGCGSRRGSARGRSSSITTDVRSPGTSGCTAGSAPRRSWITISSCSCSSPARSPARSRCAKSASVAPGRTASISSGKGSGSASARPRRRGRWSTCCCCAASYPPARSSSPCAARLAAGALDGRAVQVLARRAERAQPGPLTDLDARLAASDRPVPDLADYDQLLDQGAQ